MGVDTQIRLPGNVRIERVAEVMGKLVGLKSQIEAVEGSSSPGYLRVAGLSFTSPLHAPSLACIHLAGIQEPGLGWRRGESTAMAYYNFESDGSSRSLHVKSTAFWIAVARGLVDFFGGSVVYQDSDGAVGYSVPEKSDQLNQADDGDAFYDLERRIHEIKPLTAEAFTAALQHAAYKRLNTGD